MAMEINSVNQTTVRQLLGAVKAASSTDTATTATEGNDYISASLNEVSISAFGQQINELYAQAGAITDPASRERATQGLTAVMQQFASAPDSQATASFMNTMRDIAQTDAGFFQEFLVTAADVDEGGYDLQQWVDTFSRIGDRGTQQSFVRETGGIIRSDEPAELVQATFDEFLTTTNRILDFGLEGEELTSRMEDFFTGMASAEDLGRKREVMANFGEGNQ